MVLQSDLKILLWHCFVHVQTVHVPVKLKLENWNFDRKGGSNLIKGRFVTKVANNSLRHKIREFSIHFFDFVILQTPQVQLSSESHTRRGVSGSNRVPRTYWCMTQTACSESLGEEDSSLSGRESKLSTY